MIAPSQPAPRELWRRQILPRRRQSEARPAAALGYLTNGPAIEGLIEIEKLVLVVLFDEPESCDRRALRLAGYSGRQVPWGVRWGGEEQSVFYKDLLLEPMPEARGRRLDLASVDLLRLGLDLDRDIQRHLRFGKRFRRGQVLLPRLWAGFRPGEAENITGQGPELEAHAERVGRSPSEVFQAVRRSYFGLTLLPLAWVSHHWQAAVTVLADLNWYPRRQVIPLDRLPDDLVGCHEAAEYDFWHSRFRQPSGCHLSPATMSATTA